MRRSFLWPLACGALVAAAMASACSNSSPGPAAGACDNSGGPASGAADTHCAGKPAQATNPASCMNADGGTMDMPDAGPVGVCGANSGSYGDTMSGTAGDDDDCKYHVTWSVTPVCTSEDVFFTVVATKKSDGTPATGAAAFAELCLSDTHPAPVVDSKPPSGKQTVVENPPGTYKVGPVQFDASGQWTVRFHFFETCFDVVPDSPHGHAAFFVEVP